ncbi:MAG: type IV pilus modification protein PilV [Xanthomonadales bacterium PRO7]|jgi:type IV pilus assembly protein PilV|nr:type IV pilus modification protein PilV [Xanthomonadales bacterium PRO7]HMM56788.1 type IV pilus modification protein PilV [Rudaea sp.]
MPRNGFTLLEVLIALLVFSLGLLGMAGLLAVSVQTNHSAYLRTQATFLAQGMADRMRANNIGLWNLSYNGTYNASTAGAASGCLGATSCSPAQVAARDATVFSNQLVSFLPSPSATITCVTTGANPSNDTMVERPPYNGQCTINMSWNEKSSESGQNDHAAGLTWVFQP